MYKEPAFAQAPFIDSAQATTMSQPGAPRDATAPTPKCRTRTIIYSNTWQMRAQRLWKCEANVRAHTPPQDRQYTPAVYCARKQNQIEEGDNAWKPQRGSHS
eukprot:5158466-Amphidinium_carterae.1